MGDWHNKLERSNLQLIIYIKSTKKVPPNMTYAATYSPKGLIPKFPLLVFQDEQKMQGNVQYSKLFAT